MPSATVLLCQSHAHHHAVETLEHVRRAIHPMCCHVLDWGVAREWRPLDFPVQPNRVLASSDEGGIDLTELGRNSFLMCGEPETGSPPRTRQASLEIRSTRAQWHPKDANVP